MSSDKENKNPKPKPAAPKGERPAKSSKPRGKSDGGSSEDGKATGPRVEPRLQTRYKVEVSPLMADKFPLKNVMQRPRITSVIVNVNMGRHLENNKLPANVKTTVIDTIQKVTGQKPIILIAKKSVSNFKVREGAETAAMVTLRRDRMWHFLDRFINLACPRIKDFRGLKDKAFDGQGNYSIGLTEQGVFPEINMADATFTHGMNININFSKSSPEVSKFILTQLGMPFRKEEKTDGKKK